MRCFTILFLTLSWFLFIPGPAAAEPDPMADQIRIYMESLQKAIREGNTERAATLTKALFPDEERLKKALRKKTDAQTIRRILAFHGKFRDTPQEQLATMFKVPAACSEVKAYGATGKEIAANQKGTVVFNEFPGGAVKLAQALLHPDTRFYEVECTEPGKSSGTKFHLFFYDGEHWNMLGPAWRVLKDQ